MSSSSIYIYRDRNIIDLKTLLEAFRFAIVNFILAIIFFFLIIEEIDWNIFSSREKIADEVIDRTSWNLNNLFCRSLKI